MDSEATAAAMTRAAICALVVVGESAETGTADEATTFCGLAKSGGGMGAV
jgi:hypothetical protein|tara:strand:- start:1424 stop:1573 length:150 start_codon:yes stop_codon:yes gene_type:complete